MSSGQAQPGGGALPSITIGGRRWLIDNRLGELRAEDNPADRLTEAEAAYLIMLEAREFESRS